MPGNNFVRPEIACLRIVPVGEDSVAGPDSANVLASIGIFQEDVILVSAGVGIITEYNSALCLLDRFGNLRVRGVLRVWNVDSRIYNGNITTATAVQFVYELLTLSVWITMLIIVKVTVTMHIINVIPSPC